MGIGSKFVVFFEVGMGDDVWCAEGPLKLALLLVFQMLLWLIVFSFKVQQCNERLISLG